DFQTVNRHSLGGAGSATTSHHGFTRADGSEVDHHLRDLAALTGESFEGRLPADHGDHVGIGSEVGKEQAVTDATTCSLHWGCRLQIEPGLRGEQHFSRGNERLHSSPPKAAFSAACGAPGLASLRARLSLAQSSQASRSQPRAWAMRLAESLEK